MTQNTLTQADLMQFTGSEHWYRHTLVPSIVYTDGARHLAKFGGAYWLLDEIALAQALPVIKAEAFQLWTLTVHSDHKATLTCTDGNDGTIYTKPIPWAAREFIERVETEPTTPIVLGLSTRNK